MSLLNPRFVSRLRGPLVLAVSLVFGAAFAQGPFLPVTDASRTYQGYGYSVRPPPGEGWMTDPRMAGHQATFFRMPTRKQAKRGHTIAAAVGVSRVSGCDTTATCLDRALAEMREIVEESRYRMERLDVVPDPAAPPDCHRIAGVQQDRGVPGHRGKDYQTHFDGLLCSHPDAPSLILHPNVSERLREGERRTPVDPEVTTAFLRSFETRPVDLLVDAQQPLKADLGALAWDGARLWIHARPQVLQLDLATGGAVRGHEVQGRIATMGYGGGSLWLGEHDESSLTRMDPESGAVMARVQLPGSPVDMAFTDESAWIVHWDHGAVVQADLAADAATEALTIGSRNAAVLAAFGSLWVSNLDQGEVHRIDAETRRVTAQIAACNAPLDLAALGGFVWVGCYASGRLVQVDPESNRVERSFQVGGSPWTLDGSGRHLWIVNRDQGTVSRFDIDRGEVTAIVPFGPATAFVLAVPGSVWVTEQTSGTVYRMADP